MEFSSVLRTSCTPVLLFCCRFETRGDDMSHAQASARRRASRDLQFRRHALHGLRVVSIHTNIVCLTSDLISRSHQSLRNISTDKRTNICKGCRNFMIFIFSMDGSDLGFEVVRRATAGFVYSEAVAR